MSESAASAKRVCFMFGAKPAQSETPARARGQAGVHPEEGAVEGRCEAYRWVWKAGRFSMKGWASLAGWKHLLLNKKR